MKKILTLVLLSVLLISCGTNENNKENNKKTEHKVEKFADVTKYIKSNITDDESDKLIKILEERKEIQKEISSMIKKATIENKDEIFTEIVKKRKNIEEKILNYVSEDNKILFKTYFDKYNKIIKKTLNNK